MKQATRQLAIRSDDYVLINRFLQNPGWDIKIDWQYTRKLMEELDKCERFEPEQFPKDAVRLHSVVVVKEVVSGKEYRFTIVMPDKADVKLKHVSLFAPMGIALLGYRQGDVVQWEMPSGIKQLEITAVHNE
jgi:regulator of nucleoside diphosphate kinase